MFCMQVLLLSFGTVKTENQKLLRVVSKYYLQKLVRSYGCDMKITVYTCFSSFVIVLMGVRDVVVAAKMQLPQGKAMFL